MAHGHDPLTQMRETDAADRRHHGRAELVERLRCGASDLTERVVDALTTNETSSTIAFLQRLSRREIAVAAWNEVETRVEGVFTSADLAMIAGDPLVIAAVERPTIALSDERATLSVTSLTPGTTPGKYKKWLGDLCESCGNLSADGYYIGFADVGLDGGSHAATAQISGEPDASGLHRADMPPSRIVYGSSFEDPAGEWAPAAEITPDSTGTKHDVRGHGTLVAAVAAGDPGTSGLTDGEGFLWGLGVAPTAGMLITKINPRKIAIFATPVDGVTADARSHPTQIAYVQNHSYNQYNGAQRQNCDKYYDGYYSILSRDFDAGTRDADADLTGNQPILLTVSAGNIGQQGYASDTSCHPRRYLTLPPATAKNVLALGMAENVRPDSTAWNCYGALAQSHDNIAGNGKTGTATTGWFKPDLMAVAANIASSRSNDLSTGDFSDDYCQNQVSPPSLPSQYLSSTGTSFAAPLAAGAALLASRSYAARTGGNASSASPALLKAMLIAGAVSMREGLDRSRVRTWRPNVVYRDGELAIPRAPNGRVYRASTGEFGGYTGTTEPSWPAPGGGGVVDKDITWYDDAAEAIVGSLPNDRQGFGRLSLKDVLRSYPARYFVNQDASPDSTLDSGQAWTKPFKVHDAAYPVRVVLVWTDPPKVVEPPAEFIIGPPLVNNLDLSIELGSPCSGRYIGNVLSSDEISQLHQPCTAGATTFDTLNNVEVVRFFGVANSDFVVRVAATEGVSNQDFALVVYNAYDAGLSPPPATPANLSATATSGTAVQLTWTASSGAASYQVQRSSGAADSYVTLPNAPLTNSYSDGSVVAGRTYLYRVRAVNTTGVSDFSNVDPATTIVFDDDPLVAASTLIRAIHVTQLREAATAMRAASGLINPYPWTDTTISAGTTIVKADHLVDLRLAIDQARVALGLTTASYTDGILTPGSTPVREIHIRELRKRTK